MKWEGFISAADRPAILNQKHSDWLWPLKYIPRWFNAFQGAATPQKPVPDPGTGYIRLWPWPEVARQTKGGWFFRLGFRWDDIDKYYDLGVTFKRENNS